MIAPLSPHVRSALDRELMIGERVLWAASPDGRRMKGGLIAAWLFAVPWTAFALFWESAALLPWFAKGTPSALAWSAGIIMPLFGLPFIAVGLWMLWMPVRAMQKARNTAFVLTDRRLIRLTTGRGTETTSLFVERTGPIERHEGRDGWGRIAIQTHSTLDSEGDRTTEKFEMVAIPDVARLHRLIIERQDAARLG